MDGMAGKCPRFPYPDAEKHPHRKFLQRTAYYFAELNYIHPFREGNGRATREFMRLLFLLNGYEVDWGAASV